MSTTANRSGFWNDQVWKSIDDGVTRAVGTSDRQVYAARAALKPIGVF